MYSFSMITAHVPTLCEDPSKMRILKRTVRKVKKARKAVRVRIRMKHQSFRRKVESKVPVAISRVQTEFIFLDCYLAMLCVTPPPVWKTVYCLMTEILPTLGNKSDL